MRYRREDENADYSFGQGDHTFLSDSPEAVAQAVRTRLALWRGQWFLDSEEGTPWRQAVLGKHNSETYGLAIKQRILNTPGVRAITDFSAIASPETRKITVTVRIQTLYGETSVISEV
ncbi:MAG: hypothetical protein ACMX3H_17940 [Sodalis sp. (in: enterobacteria)]|uniref:hypothetical protein n=1 Tax=Sodalis sp. (in: enterobacteria) TaxID=1898979 RepID=UPI0039E4CF59